MKRSKFNLSHYNLLSCDMGELIPCGVMEVLPGDTVQHATSCLLRCSPLVAPIMHPVHARIHHWYVPYRLIWDDWEDFITGGPDGEDDSAYPTKTLSTVTVGTLADYLGVPLSGIPLTVSALPFRAYDLIYNEWYRDQDLVNPVNISTASGVDSTTDTTLLVCAWEKDYYTSSRPWEQKGPAITIPLGTTAPIQGFGVVQGQVTAGAVAANETARGNVNYTQGFSSGFRAEASGVNGDPEIYADLSGASAVTINLLREAFALQRFEEARARYGSRYTEYLRYLGVRSSDARLQRPEYLGGGKNTFSFSEVLQTSPSEDEPVGQMYGHGITGMRSNRYRRFFEEHGIVISLLSIRPKTMYMQGINRFWNRRTKEDFWQQELQHIGQQEVLNKEIFYAAADPEGTFGFQDRYDEYRRMESRVSGEFRTPTLDIWHMARRFDSEPALNGTFVHCVPTERTFAVPGNDVIYCMARHSIQARRLVAQVGKSFIY